MFRCFEFLGFRDFGVQGSGGLTGKGTCFTRFVGFTDIP